MFKRKQDRNYKERIKMAKHTEAQAPITKRIHKGKVKAVGGDSTLVKNEEMLPQCLTVTSLQITESRNTEQPLVQLIKPFINMTKVLEDEIEVLRIKLNVNEKQIDTEKRKIAEETSKEKVDLKTIVAERDDKMEEIEHQLISTRDQLHEIKNLKTMLKEARNKASQLAEQHEILLKEVDDRKEEYESKEKEISDLKAELTTVTSKLCDLEIELKKNDENTKFVNKQTLATLKHELQRTSERMNRKMSDYESEARLLREENAEIANDVKYIKKMLQRRSGMETD